MKKLLFASLVLVPGPAFAEGARLSEVLNLTEQYSHAVTAAQKREQVTESAVGESKSGFYPTLDAEAIDSTGFPGSTGLLGIGGVMGSPYRSGFAYGVVSKANLWDFGRTLYGVRASEHANLAEREKTRLSLIDLDQRAARAYFDCVRFRSQQETWSFVAKEAKLVAQEVKRFVSTGQRSVIDRYLAESQEEEAVTSQADFAERFSVAQDRLRLFTGVSKLGLCPLADQLGADPDLNVRRSASNPWIANAQEEVKVAEAQAKQVKADYLPQLVGVGAVGYLNSARLVAKKDYALGIGIKLPLFEGFKTQYKVQEAEARVEEREALVSASQEDLDRASARYDDLIRSAKVRLEHLEHEYTLANDGYQLARKRYGSLQGTLVDVREALRNLTRVKTQWNDAQSDYWTAKISKELFLGNRLAGQHDPVAREDKHREISRATASGASERGTSDRFPGTDD